MKKLFFATLIIMIISAFSVAFAQPFSDVPETMWAHDVIERWAKEGIIVGYEDGSYKPNRLITRAEFASMLDKMFEPKVEADMSKFKDMDKDAWYYGPMARVYAMGAMVEVTPTTMQPNAYISREEAVAYLNSILRYTPVSGLTAIKEYLDYDEISESVDEDIEAFTERGFLVGYPDGYFRPAKTITRAEAAQIFSNVINMIVKDDGITLDFNGVATQTIIVKAKNVTIKNADNVNIIFLNDEIKDSTKGLSKAKKDDSVVINKGKESTSKSTTKAYGGSSSSKKKTTNPAKTVTLNVNYAAEPDCYYITKTNFPIANGDTLKVTVDGQQVFSGAVSTTGNNLRNTLVQIADTMKEKHDTQTIINTLEYDTYQFTGKEKVRDWGKATVLKVLNDDPVALADFAQAHQADLIGGKWSIAAVYGDLTEEQQAEVYSDAMQVLQGSEDFANATNATIVSLLNELLCGVPTGE